MKTFLELFEFIKQNKSYWIAPVIFILLIIGFILFFASGTALAPFIYSIF